MAVSDGSPTPQMVGNAFVEQYYSILHQEPDQVHRFYHESSVLSRPEEDGSMTTVTTTVEINKKILSQDYTSFRVEILSADAQSSHKDGVIVVVTGCLTGSDNLKRKFTQSFFLAPQDKGYFVLNDIFRYIDEYKSVDIESVPVNDADESAPTDSFTPEPEVIQAAEDVPDSQTTVVDDDISVSKDVSQPLENGKLSVPEKIVPVNHVKESSHLEHHSHAEKAASSNSQEDTPKKSFASIVNALKENAAPFHMRASPVKAVEQPRVLSIPASEAPTPSVESPTEKSNENGGKAYAIFVANLPMNATVEQLERVFKKFGPIKRDGIQVRSSKQQGSCFGFVEFESATSMQSALELTVMVIMSCVFLFVAANSDRGRYSSGRGGYRNDRNDNFRGRGNFGGGGGGRGGYGNRNDNFEKRGEFTGRPRGGNNGGGRSNGEVVARSYQNGGKVTRQPVKVQ
ncbi:hypothetical protein LR48_Vigan01g129800 [Vigna angularis]|uniref:NTF2 domain-containing protein n=1 Tax=Phaseolus angularis TaxID=3914 RepID=A0A0L9TMC4_PHAAN|nr:hypothetical protein LR48_Vigan01g129800 [Vigna angularis]